MGQRLRTIYRFNEFELDPAESRLSHQGEEVPLQPKVFEALLVLAQRPGQLVTKQELLDALWPDTFVSEEALAQVIHKLRRALGDSHDEPRFVQTVLKRGFRFLPDVSEEVLSELSRVNSEPNLVLAAAEAEVWPAKAQALHVEWVRPATLLETVGSSPPTAPQRPGAALLRKPLFTKILLGTVAVSCLIGAAFVARQSLKPQPEASISSQFPNSQQRVRRLTFFLEREEDANLSPDGKSLVFCSTHEGDGLFKLYMMPLSGGTPVRLTQTRAEEFAPRFSPDGKWIAYGRGGGGESGPSVWKVAAAPGGQHSLLAADAKLPDWSPDGQELIFVRALPGGERGVVRKMLRDEREQVVLRWAGFINALAWSPDGAHIAFISEDSIWVMPAQGGRPRRLTEREVSVQTLAWTPDSQALICDANRSGRPNLWLVSLAGTAPAPITAGSGFDLYPSLSRDWKHLLYTNERWHRLLWQVEPDGTRPRNLAAKTTYLSISVDPSGRFLAYTDESAAETEQTMGVLNRETLEQRGLGLGSFPAFSPDGKRLAFLRKATGEAGLWLIELATGQRHRLSSTRGFEVKPAWSPDGNRLVFQRAGGNESPGLVLIETVSGHESLLASGQYRTPAWSPDGRWIAACGKAGADDGLYLFEVASGRGRLISELRSYEAAPVWAADSRSLRLLIEEQTKPALLTLNLDGAEMQPRLAFEFRRDPSFWGIFDVQPLPAGGWLYTLQRVEGDIYLIENPFPNRLQLGLVTISPIRKTLR